MPSAEPSEFDSLLTRPQQLHIVDDRQHDFQGVSILDRVDGCGLIGRSARQPADQPADTVRYIRL